MSKKIDIAVGLNASDVAKGAADGEKALEKLHDAVADLEKKTAKADGGKEIGDGFRKGAKEGERALDKLEAELKDVQRSARSVGDEGSVNVKRLGGAAQEVSQEIGQNFGEAVSSIRGDLGDLAQVGQDTLGGLAATVAGLGPAGLIGAAGLGAAAVGWGLVTASIEENEEKQRALNEAAAEWADVYSDSASRIVSAAHIVAEINDIATNPDRYKQATDSAKNWGVSVSNAMLAMAGDTTAMEIAQDGLNRKISEWDGLNAEYDAAIARSQPLEQSKIDRMRQLQGEVQAGSAALGIQTEAMRMGAEMADNEAAALYNLAQSAGTATGATDDLGNAIINLPDGKQVVIDAQTGKAFTDLDALERKVIPEKPVKTKADTAAAEKKIRELEELRLNDKTGKVSLNVDTSAWNDWRPRSKTVYVDVVPRGEYAKGLLG